MSETHFPGVNNAASNAGGCTDNSPGESPCLGVGDLLADRFRIICFLGGGGMGEVYAANDTLISAQVALKVVRSKIASDEGAIRHFYDEIQLARIVTHPNVCRIFEVGTHQRVESGRSPATNTLLFFAMELLDGESLAERLRSGRLTRAEAFQIFPQITGGLAAAHSAGVIHGDLKPSNIMLVPSDRGVRAVVTDFGLATSSATHVASEKADEMKKPGVGTPAYMSPEQRAGAPITPASDIYSLGIVMYLAATGHLPILSGSSYQTKQQFRDDIRNLPNVWAEATTRCIAINPDHRFKDGSELLEFIQRPRGRAAFKAVPIVLYCVVLTLLAVFSAWIVWRNRNLWNVESGPTQKQIAVIPFEATDDDPRGIAFGKGLAETLAARLTKLSVNQPIQVVPPGEIRDAHVSTVQQARRDFGVNLGIEGSVRRSGSKMRVTYTVVDAISLKSLYSETVTVNDEDSFALEDQVSTGIENALHLEVDGVGRPNTFRPTTQPAAYDFYLQGRGYLQDYARPEAIESAINVLSRSIELDPNYGPAYAALGQSYWRRYEETRDSLLVPKAKSACGTAIQLQRGLPDGHVCFGMVYTGTGDYSSAETHFRQALSLDPTSDDAIRGLGAALARLGKPKEAEENYQRAIRLRPNYWIGYNMLGVFYFQHGRYADAEVAFRQMMALSPDNFRGPNNVGGLYLLQGRYADAIPLLQRAVALRPASDAYSNLASAYFFLHRYADASAVYRTAISKSERDYVLWGNLAEATQRIPNKRAEARRIYEKAIDLGQQQLRTTPKDATLIANLALYEASIGNKVEAFRYIEKASAEDGIDPLVRFKAAEVFYRCGDVSSALHWLSAAVDAGYSRTFGRDTPSFQDLHNDPRFQKIFQK